MLLNKVLGKLLVSAVGATLLIGCHAVQTIDEAKDQDNQTVNGTQGIEKADRDNKTLTKAQLKQLRGNKANSVVDLEKDVEEYLNQKSAQDEYTAKDLYEVNTTELNLGQEELDLESIAKIKCDVSNNEPSLGQVDRCQDLAHAALYGNVNDVNYKGVTDILNYTCKFGIADACFSLGFMNVEQKILFEPKIGVKLMKRACDLGDIAACERGRIIEENDKQ